MNETIEKNCNREPAAPVACHEYPHPPLARISPAPLARLEPDTMFDTFAPASRRQFLARNAMGIGSVALAWLLKQERLLAMPANVRKARRHST